MTLLRRGIGAGGGGIRNVEVLPYPKKGSLVYLERDYYLDEALTEEDTTFTIDPVRLDRGIGNFIAELQDERSDLNAVLAYDSNRYIYIEFTDELAIEAESAGDLSIVLDGVAYETSSTRSGDREFYIETQDQVVNAWVVGTPVSFRIITADGRALAPNGEFIRVRDDDEAPIKQGFYSVEPETLEWVAGFGLADGGLPAVFLPEKGLLEADIADHNWRGVKIALSREDAGDQWRLRTVAGNEPVQASLQIAGQGGGTLTVTLGAQAAGFDTSGDLGNGWAIRVGDAAGAVVTAQQEGAQPSGLPIRIINVEIPAAGATLIEVRDALNGIAGVTAVSAGGANSFPRVNGAALDQFVFAGGIDGSELGAEYDAAAKTVSIEHLISHTQQDVVDALNGFELDVDTTLYASLIGGSDPALGLVDPPLSRPFVDIFSVGSIPRPSSDDVERVVRGLVKDYAIDGGPLIAGTDAVPGFVLESELTQSFLLGIIGLTQAELNKLFLDARVTGAGAARSVVIDRKDGSTVTLALGDTTGGTGGGGGADGSLSGIEFSPDGLTLTARVAEADGTTTTYSASVPAALRNAGLSQAQVQALINAAEADDLDAADVAAQINAAIASYRQFAGVSGKSANYALQVSDRGDTIRATGAAELTISLGEVVPTGWWARLLNNSTAALTFDVGVTNRIEGAGQTLKIAAGNCVAVQYLGASTWGVITDTAGAAASGGGGDTEVPVTISGILSAGALDVTTALEWLDTGLALPDRDFVLSVGARSVNSSAFGPWQIIEIAQLKALVAGTAGSASSSTTERIDISISISNQSGFLGHNGTNILFTTNLADRDAIPLRIGFLTASGQAAAGGGDGTDQTARDGATEALEAAQTNSGRLDVVEPLVSDVDRIVDGVTWQNAPAAEAQFAAIAAGSALGQKLSRVDPTPIDPAADIPNTTQWHTVLNPVPDDSEILIRIDLGLAPIQYQMRHGASSAQIYASDDLASDENWEYYGGGVVSGGASAIQKRVERFHTAYHGELSGRALAQINQIDNRLTTGLTGVDDKTTVALARTQRLRPINQWISGHGAQTLLFEWKPVGAVANNAAIAVSVAGANIAGVTTSEGLAAADTNGTVLSIPINDANAGTIDRTSNTIEGHVEVQITHGGVVDSTWVGVRKSNAWRPVAGASPYTVRADDIEFLVAMTQTNGVNVSYFKETLEKVVLTQAARNFPFAEANPDAAQFKAWIGVTASINAAGTELTMTKAGNDLDSDRLGQYAIVGIWAR